MWKRLVILAVFGLLASCGQQEVSAQDPQRTETSYKYGADVSKIIKLDDFFNGESDLYSKLDESNDTKSNYISINGIGYANHFWREVLRPSCTGYMSNQRNR